MAKRSKEVIVRNRRIYVNGKPSHLLSGEVHYWRLNPRYWGKCLDELKAMGLDIVATYVCWEFSETSKGRFDFTGKTSPHTNLTGFLELAASKGLHVIYRPGPYIYSEWTEMGIPAYAAKYHRDSDEFKRLATPYIKAVSEAALEFQATRGGPIVLWQADNEIDFMPWAYERELGLGDKPGGFQVFLEEKYGAIDALNKAWDSEYRSFNETRATQSLRVREHPYLKRYMDYMEYRHLYNARHSEWMVQAYKSFGVDVPMYLNSYPHQDSLDWRGLQSIADVVGIDPYPANEFSDDPGDHKRFVEKVVFQNSYAAIPYIAEYEAGVWYGQHKFTGNLTANHYRLSCYSALGGGICGWNWYMLVNRDNWLFSPINERGIPNDDIAPAFKEITSAFKAMAPADAERMTNTAVTFKLMHHALRDLPDRDPAMDGLYKASVPYEFHDLRTGSSDKPLTIYSGPEWLSADSAAHLRSYVENGGNLVFFINYPRHDEEYLPAEYFGLPRPEIVLPVKKLGITLGKARIEVQTEAFAFSRLPGKGIKAKNLKTVDCEQGNVAVGEEYLIGSIQKIGKGEVLFLAIQPNTELLLAVHEYFNVGIPCRSLDSDVHATLFRGKRGVYYIVVTNLKDEDTTARIAIDRGSMPLTKPSFSDVVSGEILDAVVDRKSVTAYIPVGRKDGRIVRISS